jgi:PKD repeat protein
MVVFSAVASNSNGDALTYSWNFGDGAQGGGVAVTHAYALPGTYHAVVTADNGLAPVTSSVDVAVVAATALIGFGPDSDGDGFSDAFETANGSNPLSAASTPFNNIDLTSAGSLTVGSASIKLNFASSGKDAIKFTGTIAVPAGFAPATQTVYVTIGNVLVTFPLSSKGSSKIVAGSFALKLKATKGVVGAQTSAYTVALANGKFAANLTDFGLTNASGSSSVNVQFGLYFNNAMLTNTRTMSYTATKGKSGTAK